MKATRARGFVALDIMDSSSFTAQPSSPNAAMIKASETTAGRHTLVDGASMLEKKQD